MLVAPALVQFLTDAFNDDPHWDKIAQRFITATGDIREEGATAIIMAQMGSARGYDGRDLADLPGHPDSMRPMPQPSDRSLEARAVPRAGRILSADCGATGQGRRAAIVRRRLGGPRAARTRPTNGSRGSLEHHMPDLNHPDEEGKLMKPVFFVTGQRLETGLERPGAPREAGRLDHQPHGPLVRQGVCQSHVVRAGGSRVL